LIDSVLPHEVTHTIFASHFRRPLPRWADEGACTTVEDISERSKQDRMLIQFLHTGRGIAFSQMFAMTDYPQDILPLYAQGYSLARFLIDQKGRRAFLAYVGDGMESGNWSATTYRHYGFKNLAVLQDSWLDWVKQGSPSQSPDLGRGTLASASKAGPAGNMIVRAQSADRSPAPPSAINGGAGAQWSPLADRSATTPPPAPIRNGSVAMAGGSENLATTNATAAVVPASKSVYGEGVGMIRHSADFRSDSANGAAQPDSPPPSNPPASAPAASQPTRDRRVLLEWSRQPQ
jgi:hypothetical protein